MWPNTKLECILKPSGQDPRQDFVVSVQQGNRPVASFWNPLSTPSRCKNSRQQTCNTACIFVTQVIRTATREENLLDPVNYKLGLHDQPGTTVSANK
jgi:hypothetical protein